MGFWAWHAGSVGKGGAAVARMKSGGCVCSGVAAYVKHPAQAVKRPKGFQALVVHRF